MLVIWSWPGITSNVDVPSTEGEKPTMTVSPRYQVYYCFGCETGGNVFTFVKRVTGASFTETVWEMGQKVGIKVQ